jgi:quercetin dioxygenase-like cupin family protein
MRDGDGAARAFGLEAGEGEARWWGGGLATIKVTGKQTGDLYSIVEILEPQGAQAPLHVHRKEDEAFYVLEGEMTFHIGEETIEARPGSFVFGPKDVPHTYTVDSGPAKLLFLLSPPGFEGFIEAISEPAKAHPAAIQVGGPVGRGRHNRRGRVRELRGS